MLYRGNHKLPYQSQVTSRDLEGELIEACAGREALAWMLTDEQVQERKDGKPGTGLPYRFLVWHPKSAALSWTAFYDEDALLDFVNAYGLEIVGTLSPGCPFRIRIPAGLVFQPLVERS